MDRHVCISMLNCYRCYPFNVCIVQVCFFRSGNHVCLPVEGAQYIEGDDIILNCEVIYHGYKAPTLRWWIDDDEELLPSYMDNPEENPDMLR